MKINWKQKLTSRKFWIAVAGLVVGILLMTGTITEGQADTVSGVIVSLGSIIMYLIAEAATDIAHIDDPEPEPEPEPEPANKETLRFRPFGKFEIDEGLIFRNVDTATTTFKVAVEVDPISGNASLYYGKSAADIYLGSANVMISLPLSSESYSSAKIASGVLSVVGAVAATVATEGAAAPTIASAAVNAISSAVPNISITGGEQVIIDDGPTVESYRKFCEDYPDDLYGRPYYVRNRIYNLTGFIKTGTVNIEGTGFASMLDNERTELENIMKAGFYA